MPDKPRVVLTCGACPEQYDVFLGPLQRGIEIKQEVWCMAPSEDREEKRSKTYPGIARALALQITKHSRAGIQRTLFKECSRAV